MCIQNPVYNSLDVKDTVFPTFRNFVSEMTLGHIITLSLVQVVTLKVEQIVCILGVNRANCDTITKLGM